MLLKAAENTFVPYRQEPHRPLSDAEWAWRLSAAAAFGAGLTLTLFAIPTEKNKQRPKQALIARQKQEGQKS